MNTNYLYVKVVITPSGLFDHQFYYGTDLRFNKEMPCVDAAAIYAWCYGKRYTTLHITF